MDLVSDRLIWSGFGIRNGISRTLGADTTSAQQEQDAVHLRGGGLPVEQVEANIPLERASRQ